jgi:uncharacterized protein YbgA (DUF1722 family)/uncharacterized protein YbbK (DUF523 family)
VSDRIIMGVSSCLLGNNVRYDGNHKRDHYLCDTLGRFVSWIPVCPETECGLPVPREPMRLIGDSSHPRLVAKVSGGDYTEQMRKWVHFKLMELKNKNLCAFIFKSKSPSCGVNAIKMCDKTSIRDFEGRGIFAQSFIDNFPLVPVTDDNQIYDLQERENFIDKIFVYKTWRELLQRDHNINSLIAFHTKCKLLIMAHSPQLLKKLGALMSNTKPIEPEILYCTFEKILIKALETRATTKKHVNVLQHSMGYFKRQLTFPEKREIMDYIDKYSKGAIPLIVPVLLLCHFIKKYPEPYLRDQYYFNPHPLELNLRNHA